MMPKLKTPKILTQLPWTHSEPQAISNYVYFSDAEMLKSHLGIDLHRFERSLKRRAEKQRIQRTVNRLARMQYLIIAAIFAVAALTVYLTR